MAVSDCAVAPPSFRLTVQIFTAATFTFGSETPIEDHSVDRKLDRLKSERLDFFAVSELEAFSHAHFRLSKSSRASTVASTPALMDGSGAILKKGE